MEPTAVNTVLLVIVIPVVGAIAAMLLKLNRTLERLDTALVGYDGTGGMLAEMLGLRRRVHKLENTATALVLHTGLTDPSGNESRGQ